MYLFSLKRSHITFWQYLKHAHTHTIDVQVNFTKSHRIPGPHIRLSQPRVPPRLLAPSPRPAQAAPGAPGHHPLLPRPLRHRQPQSVRVNEDQATDHELDEHQKLCIKV